MRGVSVQDILDKSSLPFSTISAWLQIQSDCPDLRRVHVHLKQGTHPSKKLTNVRDVKRYLNCTFIPKDRVLVVRRSQPFVPVIEAIFVPRPMLDGLLQLAALHITLNHPSPHQFQMLLQSQFFALDINIMYLDLSKAFDKVDHTKLLGRLQQYGISGKLHDWFRSYLQGRKQQVTVWELPPENCQLHPGYLKDPCLGQFCFCCLWMIYQILLRHRELPVMPMILRFSRASILSHTVMPCNQISTILSVGPNHLGSYLISPSVNTSVSPAKNHLYSSSTTSTKRLWNLVIQRKTLVCGCQAILPWTCN